MENETCADVMEVLHPEEIATFSFCSQILLVRDQQQVLLLLQSTCTFTGSNVVEEVTLSSEGAAEHGEVGDGKVRGTPVQTRN